MTKTGPENRRACSPHPLGRLKLLLVVELAAPVALSKIRISATTISTIWPT